MPGLDDILDLHYRLEYLGITKFLLSLTTYSVVTGEWADGILIDYLELMQY